MNGFEVEKGVILAHVRTWAARELPGFMKWMCELVEVNPPALLANNPPNHVYDVEDGSLDLSVSEVDVERKLSHHEALSGTIFAYKIRKQGKFRKVLRGISGMKEEDRLEAAMAFYVEWNDGSYLSNSAEYRSIDQLLDSSLDGLDHPFYKAVCETILEGFREQGWIENPLD
jgi:hypothetical protein